MTFTKDKQYYKFCFYGFLKNLRFFDAFFILLLIDRGMIYTEIGILYAVREIIINVFEIPSGIISDTYGNKKTLLVSFVFYILSFLIFYYAIDFIWFLTAFILYGIADAFRSGTHKSMIIKHLKINNWNNQKIAYYGKTRACSQKGSALSALIAGGIVFYSDNYQLIFLISIIPYVLNLALVSSYPKELNNSYNKKVNLYSLKEAIQSFVYVLKKPQVLRIIHSSAVYSAYQKSIKDYIQPIILQVSLILPFLLAIAPQKKNALLIGLVYFIVFILTSYASRYAYQIHQSIKGNSAFITLLYGFLFGIVSGLLYFFNFYVFALVLFVGIYLIENIRKPILTGVLADNVPSKTLTSIISAQSQWKTVLTAGIAILLGVFTDYFGMGLAFVYVSIVLLILTIALNWVGGDKV